MQSKTVDPVITEEEIVRARLYGLLSHFLAAPPSDEAIAMAAGLEGDETPIGRAFFALAAAARETSGEQAEDEYNELFIGVTQGELVPYASHYLTGFLNDRPLAEVRSSLDELGIERTSGNKDPEDHIGFLCEVMSGLIDGRFAGACLTRQKEFYDAHIAPWAARFFTDLERAEKARLYKPIGTLGRLFLEIEEEAFRMTD